MCRHSKDHFDYKNWSFNPVGWSMRLLHCNELKLPSFVQIMSNGCRTNATLKCMIQCRFFLSFHLTEPYPSDSMIFYMYIYIYLYLSGFMNTWLQWVSKCPMLSAFFLVPRLWPSPPRTMGDCLHLPLSSAIIMIIILSRVLIQLARAN